MGAAAIEGDAIALRNASYEMLALGLTMKSGKESPAAKRELQLKVKQVDFLQQKLRRGVIEETPLRDLVYEAPNFKQYVVESARRDAEGLPVSEGRVYAADTFAKACDGIFELTENGEVVYKVCFAAGTLVHTDQGLVPIEKIRVGTRVLSQPEQGGERDYRPVINTVAHLDQQVYAVQVKVEGADTLTTLIATANHPFWVEGPLVDGEHWMAAESLVTGFVLQMADGNKASVHAVGLVRHTQHSHIGFAADDSAGVGIVLELREGQIKLTNDELARNLGSLELGEPYLTPVYNFEVEEFHTYYVGDAGVWVHNTNCGAREALEFTFRKADRDAPRPTCFPMDTLVVGMGGSWVEIDRLGVGDWVLSRCEKTGEQAYRRVVKKFEHRGESWDAPDIPLYRVAFVTLEGKKDFSVHHCRTPVLG